MNLRGHKSWELGLLIRRLAGDLDPTDITFPMATDCTNLEVDETFHFTPMLIARLHRLLREVRQEGGESFSGVGVLVSAVPGDLPIVPLRPASTLYDQRSTLESLVTISHVSNEFHDGFHILSPALDVTMVSLYFSPPIIPGIDADPLRRLGGRCMAALFGSTLPSVLATGVASPNYGVAVFHRGREVNAEP